jgi:hypothetical protein
MFKNKSTARLLVYTLLATILVVIASILLQSVVSGLIFVFVALLLLAAMLAGPLLIVSLPALAAASPGSARLVEAAEATAAANKSRRPATQLLTLYFGAGLIFNTIFNTPIATGFRPAAAIATVVALVYGLWLAIALYKIGNAPLSGRLAAIGLIFVIGGPLADLVGTVFRTPDLRLEQNPIVRGLLAGGIPVVIVYGYGFIAQGLLIATFSTLWLAFLRHRQTYLNASKGLHPDSQSEFVRAAIGGRTTWQNTTRAPEESRLYRAFWAFFIVVTATMSLFRLYLGLIAFGVPIAPTTPSFVIASASAS